MKHKQLSAENANTTYYIHVSHFLFYKP